MERDLRELLYGYIELVSMQTQSWREVVLVFFARDFVSKKIAQKVQRNYPKIGNVIEVQNPEEGQEVVECLKDIKEKIQRKQITNRHLYVLFLCQDHRLFSLVEMATKWKQQFGMEEVLCDYCVLLKEKDFNAYQAIQTEQYKQLRYIWLLRQESFNSYLHLIQLLVIEKQNWEGMYGLMKQCSISIQREKIYGLNTIYYNTIVQELCRTLKKEIQAILGLNRKPEEDTLIKKQLEEYLLLQKETYENWKKEILMLEDLFFVKSGYEELQKKLQRQKRRGLQYWIFSWKGQQEEPTLTMKEYLHLLYGIQNGRLDEVILEQYDQRILSYCKKEIEDTIEQHMNQIPLLYLLQDVRKLCSRYVNEAKRFYELQKVRIEKMYEEKVEYPEQMTYEGILNSLNSYKEVLEEYQWQRANYLWWSSLERMFIKNQERYKEYIEYWKSCLNVCQNFIFEEGEESECIDMPKQYNWKEFSIESIIKDFSFQKDCEEEDIRIAYRYMTKLRDEKQRDGSHIMVLFAMLYNKELEKKSKNVNNLLEMEDRKKIAMNGFSSDVIMILEIFPLDYYKS